MPRWNLRGEGEVEGAATRGGMARFGENWRSTLDMMAARAMMRMTFLECHGGGLIDLSGEPDTWPEWARDALDERVAMMVLQPDIDQNKITELSAQSVRSWWQKCMERGSK